MFTCSFEQSMAQGTWIPVATPAPHLNAGVSLLLSDGRVIAAGATGSYDAALFDILTPDANGSYINGTWSSTSLMNGSRLYFSSEVLQDGRVYVAGGEYGTGSYDAEVYDPLTDVWTLTPPFGQYISDANSEMLPDGRVLNAVVTGNLRPVIIYDPVANTWSTVFYCLGIHNESTWLKMPDNSILMVDRNTTSSERYIPSLNEWILDGTVPVSLYDPYGFETGPALLLPDGRSFWFGSPGTTAYYTPSGDTSQGTWTAGPNMPSGLGTPDVAAAMMVNGKILFAVSNAPSPFNEFPSPTYYYEFDYLLDTFIQVNAPAGGLSADEPAYFSGMLDLPDGTVLYSDQYSAQYYVYRPGGTPLEAGKPTISNIVKNGCDSFTITGTLFNGISEGASFGDDWQMNTNYPIVRLTSETNVYYARTFNWNSTGVQRGNLADTTQFTLPAGLPAGTYSLVVTANGIASDTITFIPFAMLTSSLNPAAICSNTPFTYTPTSNDTSATFTWTRGAVVGISNAEITTPQVTDPNEVLMDTTSGPVSVVYTYTITSGGCSSTQEVTVLVYPSPDVTISGTASICEGDSTTLTATGGTSYVWSISDTTASITISPATSTAYSVTGTNSYGCTGVDSQLVTVEPLPAVNFTGLPDTVCIYIENIALTGNPAGGIFNGDGVTGDVFNPSSVGEGNDTIVYFYTAPSGCENSSTQFVYVSLCTGIAEPESLNYNTMFVYPNPADEHVVVAFRVKEGGSYVIGLKDMLGRTIREESNIAVSGDNSHLIDLKGIAGGVYMIILRKGDTLFKSRIVIE